MASWENDEALFALIEERGMSVSAISDAMGDLGLENRHLPPHIRPISPDMKLIGRAMPVQEVEPLLPGAPEPVTHTPYGGIFEALDAAKAGEIFILAAPPLGRAFLGDLTILRLQMLGCAGVISDGYIRDEEDILPLNIPVFSPGSCVKKIGPNRQVAGYRCPVTIGDVFIRPGDLVMGDRDGICVIPVEAEEQVFEDAFRQNDGEGRVREALQGGMSFTEVFHKLKVV